MRDDGCRRYEDVRLTEERAQRIGRIRGVVEEYGQVGLNVTVRQIYYQFVARGWAPSGDRTYNMVQSDLNKGRLAGLIPWTVVEDRGRGLRGLRTERGVLPALQHLRRGYLLDLWELQPFRPEVWVEKQALEGVIGDICSHDDVRVDYYATKGYDSQSQQWRAGQRMADYFKRGQTPIVFYLGDHDPSGIDMTRDVEARLRMFAGVPVMVQRLALTMPQIEQYDPPPFDLKEGDSRAMAYRAQYGNDAWELDALDPLALRDLIVDAVRRIRDEDAWKRALAEEVEDHRALDEVIAEFDGEGVEDER